MLIQRRQVFGAVRRVRRSAQEGFISSSDRRLPETIESNPIILVNDSQVVYETSFPKDISNLMRIVFIIKQIKETFGESRRQQGIGAHKKSLIGKTCQQ